MIEGSDDTVSEGHGSMVTTFRVIEKNITY